MKKIYVGDDYTLLEGDVRLIVTEPIKIHFKPKDSAQIIIENQSDGNVLVLAEVDNFINDIRQTIVEPDDTVSYVCIKHTHRGRYWDESYMSDEFDEIMDRIKGLELTVAAYDGNPDTDPTPTQYTISVVTNGYGTATVNGAQFVTVDQGTPLSFEFTPNEGYEFSELSPSLPTSAEVSGTYTAIFTAIIEATVYDGVDDYVNTNTTLSLYDSVEIEALVDKSSASGTYETLWGEWYGGSDSAFLRYHNTGDYFDIGWGDESASIMATWDEEAFHTYKVDKDGMYVDGELVVTLGATSMACTNPIYIGAMNESGGAVHFGAVQVKDYEITSGSEPTYIVTVQAGDNGSATVNGGSSVTGVAGTALTFEAVADSGYVVNAWTPSLPTTITGNATYTVSFKVGAEYSFTSDGSTNYIQRSETIYHETNDIVIEATIKAVGSGDRRIYSENDHTGVNANSYYSIGTGYTDITKLRVFIRTASGAILMNTESTTTVFDGTKHDIVYSDVGGVVTLTVDDGTPETIGTYTRATTAVMGLNGSSIFSDYRSVAGNIFNAELYNIKIGDKTFGFNEGTGSSVSDDASNTYTIQGTVLESQWTSYSVDSAGDETYFYPEDYGAVGDGTTDDKAAIQSAIDAASASTATNCVVVLGEKTYRVASSLAQKSNMTLRGSGENSKIKPELPSYTFFTSANVSNSTLKDFKIASTYANSLQDYYGVVGWDGGTKLNITYDGLIFDCPNMQRNAIYCKANAAGQNTNLTIKNCKILSAGRMAIEIFSSNEGEYVHHNVQILNNELANTAQSHPNESICMSIVGWQENTLVEGNVFGEGVPYTFFEYGGYADNLIFRNNEFAASTNRFIYNTSSSPGPDNALFTGNFTSNGARAGITMFYTEGATFLSNTFDLDFLVMSTGANDIEFDSNVITFNNKDGNAWELNGCNRADIHDNTITVQDPNTDHVFRLIGSASNNAIYDNTITKYNAAIYTDSSTGTGNTYTT